MNKICVDCKQPVDRASGEPCWVDVETGDVHHDPCPEPGDWLQEQAERSRKRLAELPEWARPVINVRVSRPEPRGCRCGHPGAGCYCYG